MDQCIFGFAIWTLGPAFRLIVGRVGPDGRFYETRLDEDAETMTGVIVSVPITAESSMIEFDIDHSVGTMKTPVPNAVSREIRHRVERLAQQLSGSSIVQPGQPGGVAL